jgi:hypothetical protein
VISGGAADAPCHYKPSSAQLPTWARDGFRAPYTGWPHVVSPDGDILAVLFAEPPFAPLPPGDSGNKIIWAAKDPLGGGLTVDAHLVGTPEAVEIGEIFLGRSFVNVPKPGCWRLTLHWTLHSSAPAETIDIVYKSA